MRKKDIEDSKTRKGIMRTSHALLLRLSRDPQFDISRASVEYVDRGAPGDRSTVRGGQIISIESGWMEIKSEMKTKSIPFHRIRRIAYDEKTRWEKPASESSSTASPKG